MKRVMGIGLSLLLAFSLAGCGGQEQTEGQSEAKVPAADESVVFSSYYAAQEDPAFEYFQNSKIQDFLAMWVQEGTGGDIEAPEWDLATFAGYRILEQDTLDAVQEDLYCCIFSDGKDRVGYAIVRYETEGPALQNIGVHETTPDLYDLRANWEKLSDALAKAGIDASAVTAERVSLLDTENNRSDQAILFQDEKGDRYVCLLGGDDFTVEKHTG